MKAHSKPKRRRRRWWIVPLALMLLASLPQLVILSFARLDRPLSQLKPKPYAIVFGTSVYGNEVRPELQARLDQALALYQEKKVQKILCTGDNIDYYYDEPQVMVDYLKSKGVPSEDLLQDPMGLRTYDSLWRAKHLYKIESAILCSQHYHVQRALFIGHSMGMDLEGYGTASASPDEGWRRFTREIGARYLAFWQALVEKPLPIVTQLVPEEFEERSELYQQFAKDYLATGKLPKQPIDAP